MDSNLGKAILGIVVVCRSWYKGSYEDLTCVYSFHLQNEITFSLFH